jgi:PAS domain S-box-containing protein
LAVRILNGENPEAIKVATTESNAYMFDYRELKRFGISPDALPEGSLVIHGPPPFYEISEKQLWAALVFLIGLSVALLMAMIGRMRAVKALRVSEERFRSVINSSPMGIYQYRLEPDGRLILTGANPAADAILGVENQAFIGKTIEEAFPNLAETEVPARYREACTQGSSWHTEQIDYEDKIIKGAFDVYAFPAGPGMMACMFADITERKQAEEELQAAHRNLQDIIEFLPDATFVIDGDKKVMAWNRAMEEMTRVPKKDILGRGNYAYSYALYGSRRSLLIDLLDKPDPTIEAQYDLLKNKERAIYAENFIPSLCNGKGAYLWSKASPLFDREGHRVGAIESLRDITDRRQAEEDLKAANRNLDAFVYTVSHDLRTPLTPIIGFADFSHQSCQDRLDEQELYCLASISASGNRMLALMEDLLTLAKIGQVERPAEPFDAGGVVNEVVCGLAEIITQAGVSVNVGDLPTLRVPKTLLSQIFDNLIGNAVRYAGKDGTPIEVGGERTGDLARFYVRDHGPGIPEKERDRIFEVFYRGTTGKQAAGTGVGLATVQKIARVYGGRAWVDETKGGGSTFWVEMVDVSVIDPIT